MEEESLGTVQWPDLNLPAWDLYWENNPDVTSEGDPRIRARPSDGPIWQRRRDDGTLVSYFGGLVELANLPDFPGFDFRVRLEVVNGPGEARLAPTAVAIIARAGQPGIVRSGDFSNAGIARAVVQAAQALALAGPDGPSRKDVATLLPRTEHPGRRRSSAHEVRVEVAKVARHYHKLVAANGGEVPYGYASQVAQHVYKQSGREWQEKVRKRLKRATTMGMVKPALAKGSKRRHG